MSVALIRLTNIRPCHRACARFVRRLPSVGHASGSIAPCPQCYGTINYGTAMGMFQVKVTVANPAQPERNFEEMFWVVDTGALYTFIPEDRLASIELKPLRTRDLILADGRRDRRMLGEALLSVADLGETLTCPVLFAPGGSLYLLGATALENFAVEADPAEKRLKPIAAVIGGRLAFRGV